MARSNFWAKRLGRELATLREAAGLRQEDAGAFVERTQSRIAQIEKGTGKGIVDLSMLRALALRYDATPCTLERLIRLRENARKTGWWSTFDLPDWLADYVSLEADATHVWEAQLELVPGLLQTTAYSRLVHRINSDYTPQEVERRVRIRAQRQERLSGDDPLRVTAVMSEAALHRCRGCGDMGRDQLRYLAERAAWPNVEVLIVPFGVGLHAAVTGTSLLLEFGGELLPPMVFLEYPATGHLFEDEATVARTRSLFRELSQPGQALDADDSLSLLAEFC